MQDSFSSEKSSILSKHSNEIKSRDAEKSKTASDYLQAMEESQNDASDNLNMTNQKHAKEMKTV